MTPRAVHLSLAAFAFAMMAFVVVSHALTGFSSWGWAPTCSVILLGCQSLVWLWIERRAA